MRLLRDERGIAMVTAMLAMMVVSSLAVAGFTVSTHDLNQSANDRRRVQAIHAAEAGVDRFLNYLYTAPQTGMACSLATETLPESPPSTDTVTATFYPDATGTGAALACPPSTPPAGVLIHSVGASAGVSRTMEAQYTLTPNSGSTTVSTGAVYGNLDVNFSGSATLNGNPYGADINTNSNLTLSGGGAVFGSVNAQGTVNLSGQTDVKQNVTSKSQLKLSGGAIIRGYGRSGSADINNSANPGISGNAYYCTSYSGGGGVTGSKIKETPCTNYPTSASTSSCPSGATCTPPWSSVQPAFAYNPASPWAGYTQVSFATHANADCTSAATFITTGISSGNYIVYIDSGAAKCTLSFSGGASIPVKGNLAIISNGSLNLSGGSNFTTTNIGAPYLLYLWNNITDTAPSCNTNAISFSGQSSIPSGINAIMYTPCNVNFSGGAFTASGQIVAGGKVTFSSSCNLTSVPIAIPGSSGTGFQTGLQFRREII